MSGLSHSFGSGKVAETLAEIAERHGDLRRVGNLWSELNKLINELNSTNMSLYSKLKFLTALEDKYKTAVHASKTIHQETKNFFLNIINSRFRNLIREIEEKRKALPVSWIYTSNNELFAKRRHK